MNWHRERITLSDDAIARSRRWKQFYQEEGGIGDMIDALRLSYFRKVGGLKTDDMAGLQALGMAMRICDEIDKTIQDIFASGALAEAKEEYADKIAALPKAKRRFF